MKPLEFKGKNLLLINYPKALDLKRIVVVKYTSYEKYIDTKLPDTKYLYEEAGESMEEINGGISVIRVLKQVMDTVKQNMGHQFKEMHLTGPQGMMMGILARYGEMKISELSGKLGLSNSTVSGMIDRLEKQGLIERTRSKEDRRVVYVSVTPEFKRSIGERFNEVERKFEAMMDKATPEELEKVLQGLDTLKILMDRQNNTEN